MNKDKKDKKIWLKISLEKKLQECKSYKFILY